MKIYAININNCLLTNQELRQYLPEKVLKNIERYKVPNDYRRSLVAYAMLYIISEQTWGRTKPLTLEKNDYGKPFFRHLSDHSFNISHSKDWIVLAISNTEVGIDIEYNEPFDYEEVVESFFSEPEKQFFLKTTIEQKNKIFYRFWTLKESYIKAIGRGMAIKLDSFSIELWSRPVFVNNDKNFKLLEIPFIEDYTLSVCIRRGEDIEKIKVLTSECIANGDFS